jgi:transposase
LSPGLQQLPFRASEVLTGEQRLLFEETVEADLAAIENEPESCQCGANVVEIGEDVSKQLDEEPARFFVHRHIRPQYACRACETVTAPAVAPAVIDGGMAADDTSIICRCAALNRSRPARAYPWPARRWPSGSARRTLPGEIRR